ncbi:amidohydrolase [Microbacterium sp. NPDC077184]|uniref:amidohydrolase n=1 Tax=Microbacterium sp. NPDC077184 TaxID=3154764 RepID=UPI00342FE519
MQITHYTNGRIFTAEPDAPFVEALVTRGPHIVFVGDDEGARAAAGPQARVVDLAGGTLMPGMHDAHTHLLFSGLKYLYETRLPAFAGPDRIVEELRAHHPHPEGDAHCAWHVGGEVFPPAITGEAALTRAHLDAAFPDEPVYLYDYSIHHGVANSRALALADIGEEDEFGHGGAYIRDENGRLTGELVEEATWKVLRSIPDRPDEEYLAAVRWAVGVCHRFGITSVQEASASEQALRAYAALDAAGELDLHVAAHLVWRSEGFGMASGERLDELLRECDRWASAHVDPRFVKIWIDGAPLPPHSTHAPLTASGEIDDSWLLVSKEELARVVAGFDAQGRPVKIHCAGDGAVRTCLDAIAEVRGANGPGVVHEVAHAGFVADEDFARFRELDVTAEMSPALWHLPEYGLGDAFHFRRMLDHGARMTIGSDWIITPDPNLLPGIQGAIQHGSHPITRIEAFEAVTRVGAEAVGRSDERGTLAVGKRADLVIVDRDLFGVDEGDIGAARVRETIVGGRTVYRLEE